MGPRAHLRRGSRVPRPGTGPRVLMLLALAALCACRAPLRPTPARASLAAVLSLAGEPAFVGAQAPDSLEGLLPLLPASLRRNFTFVHHSRGLHGGECGEPAAERSIDARFPRAILWSDDARLVVAFTTAPDGPGHDQLEVLRYRDDERRFTLARFHLRAALRDDPSGALARLAEHDGEEDPPACLRCHGHDPRPLLDSYPIWPGFYGSVSDAFPPGSSELADYRAFLAEHRQRGPLRHLSWPAGTSVPPYTDPAAYDPDEREGAEEALALQPNARLGMALGELNRRRVERRLAASPRYPALRQALLAVLLGCQAPPLSAGDLQAVRRELARQGAERLARLGFRPSMGGRPLAIAELGLTGNVAQLLYVAEVLGVSAGDLWTGPGQGALALYDGILGDELDGRSFQLKHDLIVEVLRHLAADEPTFRPYFATHRAFSRPGLAFGERLDLRRAVAACGALLEAQRKSGVALPPWPDDGLAVALARAPADSRPSP